MDDSDFGVLPPNLQGLSERPRNKGGRGTDWYGVGRLFGDFVRDPESFVDNRILEPMERKAEGFNAIFQPVINARKRARGEEAEPLRPDVPAFQRRRINLAAVRANQRAYRGRAASRSVYPQRNQMPRFSKRKFTKNRKSPYKRRGFKKRSFTPKKYVKRPMMRKSAASRDVYLTMENKKRLAPDLKNHPIKTFVANNSPLTVGQSNTLIASVGATPTYTAIDQYRAQAVAGAASVWFSTAQLWNGNLLSLAAREDAKYGDELFVHRYATHMYFTNGSTTPGQLTEYIVIPKHDIQTGNNHQYAVLAAFNSTKSVMALTGQNAVNTLNRYSPEVFPDWNPASCDQFRNNWKIVKVKNYNLAPGGTMELKYKSAVKRVYSERSYSNNWETSGLSEVAPSYNIAAFANVTRFSLFCWRGVVAHQKDDATKFGWSRPQLDFLKRTEIIYKRLANSPEPQGGIGHTEPTASGDLVVGAEAVMIGAANEQGAADMQ